MWSILSGEKFLYSFATGENIYRSEEDIATDSLISWSANQ